MLIKNLKAKVEPPQAKQDQQAIDHPRNFALIMSASTCRGSLGETFAVRIRLNGNEAIRRLGGIRRGLHFPRSRIIKLCRLLEKDGKLEQQLHQTNVQIHGSVQILKECNVGEREDLGTAVLVLEHLVAKTQDLLQEVQQAAQSGYDIPSGFYLRADSLVHDFERELKFLTKVRKAIQIEPEPQLAKVCHRKRGLFAWVRRLFVWTEPVVVRQRVEHHQREHIFSGYTWEVERRCKCLNYR